MQRQDQAIVPMGRSGAGKTTCCQSALEYLVGTAGSVDSTVTGTGPGSRCELGAPAAMQRAPAALHQAPAAGLRGAWHWAVSTRKVSVQAGECMLMQR